MVPFASLRVTSLPGDRLQHWRRSDPGDAYHRPAAPLPRRPAYLGSPSGKSAITYAITAIAATQRATSPGSSLSRVSPSLW